MTEALTFDNTDDRCFLQGHLPLPTLEAVGGPHLLNCQHKHQPVDLHIHPLSPISTA